MFTRIIDVAGYISPGLKRFLVRIWYHYLTVLDKEALMTFMNFGYADLDASVQQLVLSETDEVNRYSIQLYRFIVGTIELKGLDVLEVGCGRGGGAAYLMRAFQPKSMTGVDIAGKAIVFCKRQYSMEGLSFVQGDAESLPFDENCFDVIVNVESSQCYGSMERFLQDVVRVLRPDGYFLFTDFRGREQIEELREQLHCSGLEILKEERITANVLRSLECDSQRKRKLIHQKVPGTMRQYITQFAGLQGTKTYEALKTGDAEYLYVLLHKKAVPEPTVNGTYRPEAF